MASVTGAIHYSLTYLPVQTVPLCVWKQERKSSLIDPDTAVAGAIYTILFRGPSPAPPHWKARGAVAYSARSVRDYARLGFLAADASPPLALTSSIHGSKLAVPSHTVVSPPPSRVRCSRAASASTSAAMPARVKTAA
eukprot:6173723-Pleurochrysis_carterae.AAC.3